MTKSAKNVYPITSRGEYNEETLRTFYILQKSDIIYNFSEFFPAFQRKCQHMRSRFQRLWLSFGQRWAPSSELNIPVFPQEEIFLFVRLSKFFPSESSNNGENAHQNSALMFWLIRQNGGKDPPLLFFTIFYTNLLENYYFKVTCIENVRNYTVGFLSEAPWLWRGITVWSKYSRWRKKFHVVFKPVQNLISSWSVDI